VTSPRSWLRHWQRSAARTPWRDALTRALREAHPGEADTSIGADVILGRAVAYWLLATEEGPEADVDDLDAAAVDDLLTPGRWRELARRLAAACVDPDGDGDVDDAWARLSRHSALRPDAEANPPL